MLFNSIEFLFMFLPFMVVGSCFIRLIRENHKQNIALILFLLLGSLFFYGWWNPAYLPVLGGSILFNFIVHRLLVAFHQKGRLASAWLTFGLLFNLVFLGFFKYLGFGVEILLDVFGIELTQKTNDYVENITLPLAISFFTFQQIAFLVDTFKGEVEKVKFTHFALFVSFFPQLIAGPIVHYSKTLPQFRQGGEIDLNLINRGILIFSIGLFKKVVIADSYGPIVNSFYADPSNYEASYALIGTVAYSLQLYFDFSGYCDMAIGSALLFGIRLPPNFNSPYQAVSLRDFWRRWHMTLSEFLRDYVYIPLGGNRVGFHRTLTNVIVTFTLGGVWHGAGWTFIIWGIGNGIFISLELVVSRNNHSKPSVWLQRIYTLGLVNLLWIPFRSETMDDMLEVFRMLSVSLWNFQKTATKLINEDLYTTIFLFIGFAITQIPHNTNFYTEREESNSPRSLTFASGILFGVCVLFLARKSDFLYFQF